MFFKTSDATWQAYNDYGGSSFYHGGGNGRAFKLSYNRPFATRGVVNGRDFLFANEYPMIRFLERNGYDVSYTTDVDGDRRGNLIANHDLFLSVGHDEYWSGPQRAAVEAARDSGTHLAFFSGNSVYWRTRWENSQDGTNTAHRTLVCYKETWQNSKYDTSSNEWTGTWRDPRFSPPATGGGKPENALMGTIYKTNSIDMALQVPSEQGKYRLWRNTSVANVPAGQSATLAPHTLGYEADEDIDNGFRPQGLIRVSTTTGPVDEYLVDFGNNVAPGVTTHNMTLYRAPSGALVFGAGTVQWAWGLDDYHDSNLSENAPVDVRMQQATLNLFADMGVQPTTRMASLAAASASTDTTAPGVTITSPASGATAANGTQITVSGTATDSGGRVAGVEVSTDGGTSWHPATGTTAWSYTYYATGDGSSTVRVRAIDDSANIGTAATRTVTLTGATSLFGNRVPKNPAVADTSAVELGVKIVPQTEGYVHGVRFYKGTGNTGTHAGRLWSSNGQLLASGTFSNETASGWQTLTFSQPVAVYAGLTYVASYTAPNGHYAADPWSFVYSDHVAAPLSAPRTHEAGGNGVYGSPGTFPAASYQSGNYYVDVTFTSAGATPPTTLATVPGPDAKYVQPAIAVQAQFSKQINTSTLVFTLKNAANQSVAGAVSYNSANRTATFTPSSNLAAGQTFTASVQASDTTGLPMAAPTTWSFTTDPGNTVVNTLFAANATPATADVNDSNAVTLGMKFTPSTSGTIIGMRFYKGAGNGGQHTGSLWSGDGTQRLAYATFAGESASGWQTVYFSSPVSVTAGTTYVVSYFAPIGHYSVTGNYFSSTVTNGPLSAPSTNNGVYSYGADTFPTSSWNRSNYFVDPLFVADPPPPPPTMPSGAVTVWPSSTVPANANWNDNATIELGVRFSASVPGQIHGLRFYKGPLNTGTHTGTLWTAGGTQMATGTFVGESASGWQLLLFSSPVTITPGTTYVVTYRTTVGQYAVNINGLASAVTSGPLTIPAGGATYRYGGGFPSATASHNYWVDPVFKAS
jgi:hypothetical protein